MKKYKILLLSFALLGLGSCAQYLDVNADPSNPQIAEGYVLMPPMLAQMAGGEEFDSRYVGKYVQNWATATSGDAWDAHGFQSGSDNGGQKWRVHYWNLGKNIDLQIADGTAKQKWDYVGAAQAMMAWSWQTTTDYHGEIVLKQAFEPNRYVFDYDTQEDVYKYVQELATKALENLNKTDGGVAQASFARGDLSYAGDRSKWIKMVYALLARNANHISNKSTYSADKVLEYVNKSFASNADNFVIKHKGGSADGSDGNFFGPTRNNLGTFRQTDYLVKLLDGTIFSGVVDPRQGYLTTASPDGVYRGVVPGNGDPNNQTGNLKRIPLFWGILPPTGLPRDATKGKYVYKDDADFPLLTYGELQFIKAEAAFKKGDRPTAHAAYLAGINASFDLVNSFAKSADQAPANVTIPTADRTKYLASKAVAQTPADLKISDIMLQKYLAMNGHGMLETWVDMRRYRYSPDVYTSFAAPTGAFLAVDNKGKLAYRVRPRYNSEYVWNRASLDKYKGNDPDYHTIEPWFVLP